MKLAQALVATLLIAGIAVAAPPELKVPEKIKVKGSTFITVSAETNGKSVKWVVIDPGLSLLPPHLLKDNKTVVALAPKGVYRLMAITALGDELSEPAITTIYVDSDDDPTPPPPPPPDGPPGDPLVAKFQAIYGADSSSDKEKNKNAFVTLYKQVAELVLKPNAPTTYGKLHAVVKDAAITLGISGKLLPIQEEVKKEILKVASDNPNDVIDSSNKKAISDKFLYLAGVLAQLK